MKKRALAILLVFALCIPFVLSSCLFPNGDEKEDTPSFFDEIKDTKADYNEFDTFDSFVIDAGYKSADESFVYVATQEALNEEETHVTSTHTVYNVFTKQAVYSVSIEYSIEEKAYSSLYKSVSVSFGDNVFTVAGTKASGTTEYIVRSTEGKELLKSDYEITYLNDGRILTDDKVYEYKNGEMSLVKDLSDSIVSAIIEDLACYDGLYVYYESNTLYVFGSTYKLLATQQLAPNALSPLANTNYSKYTLENGNVIFQVSGKVCDYSPDVEKRNYDYVLNGACYKLDTFFYDLATLTYKEITMPYLLSSVTSSEKLPYGAQNVAVGTLINNKELVYSGNSSRDTILLYNDGTYRDLPFANESKVFAVLSDNTYIVRDTFTTQVYDKDDNLIGTLDYVSYANEKLIVTPTTIYDHGLNVVYSLKDNDANLEYISSSAAVVSLEDTETLNTKYLVIKVGSEPSVLAIDTDDIEIFFHEGYIYTLETVRNEASLPVHKVLTVYDPQGNTICDATLSLSERLVTLDYDSYAVIKAVNEEGKIVIIVLSELIAMNCTQPTE